MLAKTVTEAARFVAERGVIGEGAPILLKFVTLISSMTPLPTKPPLLLTSNTDGLAFRPADGGGRRRVRAELGRLGLDLVDVVGGRCAVNGDPSRLHGLGDLADQLDFEQAVVEGRALHLHIVRQAELPFELPG